VQKGKFAAAMPAFVSALKRVDLPTFGRPTMPHLMPMVRDPGFGIRDSGFGLEIGILRDSGGWLRAQAAYRRTCSPDA
jgi:hypothetical protein